MGRTVSLALLGLVAACAVTGRALPSTAELAAASGVPGAVLDRGRGLWMRECAACHRLYWPRERSPAAWFSIAPRMADRAGLGPGESRDLTRFLVEASRHAAGPGER